MPDQIISRCKACGFVIPYEVSGGGGHMKGRPPVCHDKLEAINIDRLLRCEAVLRDLAKEPCDCWGEGRCYHCLATEVLRDE